MLPNEVVCVGLATADTIVSVPSWPAADGRVIADSIVRAAGGPAATAAVTLARLGHRSSIIAAVGDDEVGEHVRAGLEAEGVNVAHLVVRPGRSAMSVVVVDRSADSRAILHAPPEPLPPLGEDAAVACAAATWIHVDQAGYAAVNDVDADRLSIDAGNPIDHLDLAGVGLYAPSASALRERYVGRSIGNAVRAALDEGAQRVAVTLGADGALVADRSGAWRVASVPVEVVSTLGAGDVFHGALLASLLEDGSLAESARRACVAAALSCRALDGRAAIPARGELDAAMHRAPAAEPVDLEAVG